MFSRRKIRVHTGNVAIRMAIALALMIWFFFTGYPASAQTNGSTTTIGGINLGNLPNYLFYFDNGSSDANWQGATKGFFGDVAVNGLKASERTSGTVPYAGTLYTNSVPTQTFPIQGGQWDSIISSNSGQASAMTNQTSLISGLHSNLVNAIKQINALPATAGFNSVSSTSLNGLDTTTNPNTTFVINVTSGLSVSNEIQIKGKPGDVFILRWSTDPTFAKGYQGQVKFQSGGGIIPLGGLTPSSFINVAGDIDASGGGSNPPSPYPQGPYLNGKLITGGDKFSGGGFFTGYWLTTGAPGKTSDPTTGLYIGDTSPLSNGIFVGGWYTLTTKFSMTSGTSGVYVAPSNPSLSLVKTASPTTYSKVGDIISYSYVVTNTGNVSLTGPVTVADNKVSVACPSATGGLTPGASVTCKAQYTITQADLDAGSVTNVATASANGVTSNQATQTVTATQTKTLNLVKTALPTTYSKVGDIISYSYVVKNIGNVSLTGPVTVADNKVTVNCPSGGLAPGQSVTCTAQYTITQADLDAGSVTNVATASANGVTSNQATQTVTATQTKTVNLVKSASPMTYSKIGDIISYSYVVTNTGNISLTGPVTVADNKVTVSCPSGGLVPGASVTCHAQYTITQADLDAGSVTNVATALVNGVTSNQDTQTVTYVKTDTVAPVTRYHFDPIYCATCHGQYIKGLTVRLQATDNDSGVKSTQYRINGNNGGAWTPYTNPFSIYAGNTHTVEYYSTDNAGNQEKPNVMDFDKGNFSGAGSY